MGNDIPSMLSIPAITSNFSLLHDKNIRNTDEQQETNVLNKLKELILNSGTLQRNDNGLCIALRDYLKEQSNLIGLIYLKKNWFATLDLEENYIKDEKLEYCMKKKKKRKKGEIVIIIIILFYYYSFENQCI